MSGKIEPVFRICEHTRVTWSNHSGLSPGISFYDCSCLLNFVSILFFLLHIENIHTIRLLSPLKLFSFYPKLYKNSRILWELLHLIGTSEFSEGKTIFFNELKACENGMIFPFSCFLILQTRLTNWCPIHWRCPPPWSGLIEYHYRILLLSFYITIGYSMEINNHSPSDTFQLHTNAKHTHTTTAYDHHSCARSEYKSHIILPNNIMNRPWHVSSLSNFNTLCMMKHRLLSDLQKWLFLKNRILNFQTF